MADNTLNRNPHLSGAAWNAALRSPLVMGLAGLLVVQLLLAAVIGNRGEFTPARTDKPLAEFDPETIDRIEIATLKSENPLLLTRTDAGWSLPTLGDFPADVTRVNQLLEALADSRRPLPIATSEAARKRFKVADDSYEERIRLLNHDQAVATLIIGDSPGFRRRYLRPAGDDGVYDVRFEVFNLSDQADDWISQNQLRLERDRIGRLAAQDWTLTKEADPDGDGWILAGAAGDLDQTKVDALLTRLANLGYRKVLGSQPPNGFDPEQAMLSLEIGMQDGQTERYRIIEQTEDKAAEQDDTAVLSRSFLLKADGQPYYYQLSDLDLGPLVDLTAESLTRPPQAPTEPMPMSEESAQGTP